MFLIDIFCWKQKYFIIVKVSQQKNIKILYSYFMWSKTKKNLKCDKIIFRVHLKILIIKHWV